MEDYDHMGGMAGGVHPSFPDIGTDLTSAHGTPSEMHEDGVHRFIKMSPMADDAMVMASASDSLPNPFITKPTKGSKGKPKPIKPTPLPPNEY